jgi:hypothetical protein
MLDPPICEPFHHECSWKESPDKIETFIHKPVDNFFLLFSKLMSHISKLLDNNSKSEILLSDIKDYAIIPLGFLDYRRNVFGGS